MTSTVSSIFSTNNNSEDNKLTINVDLYELLSSSISKNTPILTSAFNNCYQRALLSLYDHVEEIDTQSLSSVTTHSSTYNVTEDDFDATVFPDRILTPSSITICQWRHEQFLNEKFLKLFLPFVAESMYSIVFNWIELELRHEEERESKNVKKKQDLKAKVYELKTMEKSINIDRLYELSGNSKDVLIDQVDWKLIGTKMRSKGGFKYFDEYSLKRLWIHRCQYGLNNSWSDQEDEILNQLIEQYGYGQWNTIAQHELFQKKKKSAFMCARRYMFNENKIHAKRRFTQTEKEFLLSMYNYRCTVRKDYRFCVSHAAYMTGDRSIRQITHVWTYLNPDIQKSSFTPEEDAILLQHTNQTLPICWATLASSQLPSRSAVQCRQRYFQLIKSKSTKKSQRTKDKINASRTANQNAWLRKQSIHIQNFLEQFYSKSRLTQLQKSIIETHSNKIELLMKQFSKNPNEITKHLPLRELILKLNTSSITINDIYTKFVNNI